MNLAIIKVLGIVLFLYLMWRNLKDNYHEDKLISYSWMALLSFFVGGRFIYGLINWGIWNDNWMDWFSVWNKPGMSLIGGYLAIFGTTYWICKSEGWKLWSFAEDSLNVFLIFFGFLMLDEFVRSGFDMRIGVNTVVIIIVFIASSFMKTRYRSYAWYKSGKKGFGFLIINALVCFVMTGVSFWFKDSIIYTGLYLLGGLISLTGLCILGEVFEELLINLKRKKNDRIKNSQ